MRPVVTTQPFKGTNMTMKHPDNVEGLYHLAEDGRKKVAAMPGKEQKAWHRLVNNWAKTLPKNDRKTANAKLHLFLEWWGAQPEKQRYRPYGFRWSDIPVNHPGAGPHLHD